MANFARDIDGLASFPVSAARDYDYFDNSDLDLSSDTLNDLFGGNNLSNNQNLQHNPFESSNQEPALPSFADFIGGGYGDWSGVDLLFQPGPQLQGHNENQRPSNSTVVETTTSSNRLPAISNLSESRAQQLPAFQTSGRNNVGSSSNNFTYSNNPSASNNLNSFAAPGFDDEPFAALFGDFSSPSLPPIGSPLPRSNFTSLASLPSISQHPGGFGNCPALQQVPDNMPITRRASMVSNERTPIDLTKDDDEVSIVSPRGLTFPATPAQSSALKRSQDTMVGSSGESHSSKRRRQSRPTATTNVHVSPKREAISPRLIRADSLFGEEVDEVKPDTVDLSRTDELPEELKELPKPDSRTKLSRFQCVICMDDVTNLMVTHCGHLFCSECLHSALHIDSVKRNCPVCRTKVDMKDKGNRRASSFYPLELKLMTTRRKGKQPVR